MIDLQAQVTARAIILNADDQMLIVRRSATDTLQPGAWDIPGGRQEPGEALQAVAIREIQEEVGLVLRDPKLLFATSDMRDGVTKTWLFFAEYMAPDATIRLSDEHDQYQWIDPADLDSYTDYDILLRLHRYLTHNGLFAE
jgi:8-oxo-dGTP diphosphatase